MSYYKIKEMYPEGYKFPVLFSVGLARMPFLVTR